MTNKETQHDILAFLLFHYGNEGFSEISGDEIIDAIGGNSSDVSANLRYLDEKGFIKTSMGTGGFFYELTASGMDEYENLQDQGILNLQKIEEKPLEFDVSHEDHTGKIKVFISHKFVESDQKLAAILQSSLSEHNIYDILLNVKKNMTLSLEKKLNKK